MKKLLFALAIMPLLIMACSSDDDIPSSTGFDYSLDMLYGEWRFTGVEVDGVPIDLTEPKIELHVPPTYLTFNEDGKTLNAEGIFGEGNGKYSTNKKTINIAIGNNRSYFDVTSLGATTAKIKLDAKYLSHLPLINNKMGMLTVTLKKDYKRTNDFDYNINMLYGKWRAISMEGVYDNPIDLKNPVTEKIYKPTFLTFEEKGVYTIKGFLGEGTGKYVTEDENIYTLVGNKNIDFEVTALEENRARIVLETIDINVQDDDLKAVEKVTVILEKQSEAK